MKTPETETIDQPIRLTQFSHGAGCGCKIAPDVLATILQGSVVESDSTSKLLIGNNTRDDAAAVDIGDGRAILSTTDFFMPIVDDPFDFGRIAATNALSDIYAMGGTPLVAVAILGWPVQSLPASVASRVIAGGRAACAEAGIALAGGHSIDSPEPIFGLAVTGEVSHSHLKKNVGAQPGDRLFLTKPLGVGIYTTAEKQGKLEQVDEGVATQHMCQLNKIGAHLGAIEGVHAMTDVTGFGLAGHLVEMCEGSHVQAQLVRTRIPVLPNADAYIAQGCVPGGSERNFSAYGHRLGPVDKNTQTLLCDPQTSGGLLIAVAPAAVSEVAQCFATANIAGREIGRVLASEDESVLIVVTD
jgi:selenide,water dikinase